VKVCKSENRDCSDIKNEWQPENTIEIQKKSLSCIVDKINEVGQCRYPLLALRILIYVIISIDGNGIVHISARHLSKSLGVNYDTVTKCLKYLRQIGVLQLNKD
jgi:hypothetical protein